MRRHALMLVAYGFVFFISTAGCGGGGGGGGGGSQSPPPQPDFAIALSSSAVSVIDGATSSPRKRFSICHHGHLRRNISHRNIQRYEHTLVNHSHHGRRLATTRPNQSRRRIRLPRRRLPGPVTYGVRRLAAAFPP